MQHLLDRSNSLRAGDRIPPSSETSRYPLSKQKNTIQSIFKDGIKTSPASNSNTNPNERELLHILKDILKQQNTSMLIQRLGYDLQFQTFDGIKDFLKYRYGGFLNFIQKHRAVFIVTGTNPNFFVGLQTDESVPATSHFGSEEELVRLARYKTIMCQHFMTSSQCPYSNCEYAHEGELRRNPFSPFYDSYDPDLCSTYTKDVETSGKNCAHGKSCLQSSNRFEFQFHPENYRTSWCTMPHRSKDQAICDKAHRPHEMRHKFTLESSSIPLAYLARNQQWDKLILRIKKLPLDEASAKFISEDVYPFSGETALHYAAKHCKIDVIELLLQFPLNVDQPDAFGQTALHKAAAYAGGSVASDWKRTYQLLLQNSANPRTKDYAGHDSFFFAKKNLAIPSLRTILLANLKALAQKYASNSKTEQTSDIPPLQQLEYISNSDRTEKPWAIDLDQMIQKSHEKKDSVLLGYVFKPTMYVRGDDLAIDESRLAEFKAISKSRDSIADIIGNYLISNSVAFLNTIESGEIGKIYFGIEDNGMISGIHLPKDEHDLLKSHIRKTFLISIDPPVTDQEYDVHFIPVCGKPEMHPVESLFVVEVHIKSAPHSVYFSVDDGSCSVRRPAGIKQVSGASLVDHLISRLKTRSMYIPPHPVIAKLDAKLLKDMSIHQITELSINSQTMQEVYQKLLEVINNTIKEKNRVSLMEEDREIAELEKQLASLQT
jgi:Putative DNA-binding domain/Ankyrin repeats (many copies)